jgi:ribosome recycling factor
MTSPIKEKMEKTIETLKRELQSVRAGRATPALLDRVTVDYYGTPTPVNQLASLTVPEPRMLVIQPWDKGVMQEIEKAIQKSDLGLNPMNDGSVIRIVIPPMTEERRMELVKLVRKMGEDAKVAIRNVRRDANDEIRKKEKAGELSTDESHRQQEQVQKLTDQYIQEVESLVREKEKDIMEV